MYLDIIYFLGDYELTKWVNKYIDPTKNSEWLCWWGSEYKATVS
jgi:hypothetical protein